MSVFFFFFAAVQQQHRSSVAAGRDGILMCASSTSFASICARSRGARSRMKMIVERL